MSDITHVDPAVMLERAADPGEFVMVCLERGKTWLAEALEHGDLDQLVNMKGYAETLRVATLQKQLGKDAVLSATELVRRAERCIGLGIRQGQECGQVARMGSKNLGLQGLETSVKAAGVEHPSQLTPLYEMANVTDDQFDAAIDEAKTEGNLSRANLTRKIKGESKPKPADRHEVHHKGRRIDPVRIVEETINTLDGVAMGLALIDDIPSLDAAQRLEWLEALRRPLAAINKFNRELKL